MGIDWEAAEKVHGNLQEISNYIRDRSPEYRVVSVELTSQFIQEMQSEHGLTKIYSNIYECLMVRVKD